MLTSASGDMISYSTTNLFETTRTESLSVAPHAINRYRGLLYASPTLLQKRSCLLRHGELRREAPSQTEKLVLI